MGDGLIFVKTRRDDPLRKAYRMSLLSAWSILLDSTFLKRFLYFFACYRQCCGSGMFIPDLGSWFLPIPDPGSKNSNKRERWKILFCHTFLCSHKFHKIVNYFSFEVLKKIIWANFQRNIELFTKKIVKKLLKIWSWDPGSEIRDPRFGIRKKPIPDPGVKKAPDPGSGSATLVTERIRIRTNSYGPGSMRPETYGRGTL